MMLNAGNVRVSVYVPQKRSSSPDKNGDMKVDCTKMGTGNVKLKGYLIYNFIILYNLFFEGENDDDAESSRSPSRLFPRACSASDVEEMESFVDLLSIGDNELVASHPEWTKEELEAFKEEVRDFEEDLNLLKIKEDEEVEEEEIGAAGGRLERNPSSGALHRTWIYSREQALRMFIYCLFFECLLCRRATKSFMLRINNKTSTY